MRPWETMSMNISPDIFFIYHLISLHILHDISTIYHLITLAFFLAMICLFINIFAEDVIENHTEIYAWRLIPGRSWLLASNKGSNTSELTRLCGWLAISNRYTLLIYLCIVFTSVSYRILKSHTTSLFDIIR